MARSLATASELDGRSIRRTSQGNRLARLPLLYFSQCAGACLTVARPYSPIYGFTCLNIQLNIGIVAPENV